MLLLINIDYIGPLFVDLTLKACDSTSARELVKWHIYCTHLKRFEIDCTSNLLTTV